MKFRAFVEIGVRRVIFAVSIWAIGGAHTCAFDHGNDNEHDALRVGIVTQAGGPHLEIYLNSLAACQGVSQVAVCDESGSEFERTREVLGKTFRDVATYRNPASMFDEFKPQLVIVAMPANLSPNMIRLALDASCHVLSEKPGCVNAEQFEELVRLAEAKKIMLMLSLPNRVSPKLLRAREIVQQGFLGKLYAVNGYQVKDQVRLTKPEYHKSWFAFKDQAGGGHLIWLGIHEIDQMLFITSDSVAEVSAFCRNVGGQPVEIEDAEALALHFKSGMVGTFHGGYYLDQGAAQSGLTLWGSNGWLRMSAHRGPDGSDTSFQWYSSHAEAPRGVQTEDATSHGGIYQSFVQATVDAARGVHEAPLTGDDSLQVLKVIFAAYRSSQTGVAQKLP
ncbi:MAG: Gfo/Idh/MocA family oxidoreductase [Planctomycetota bacterium]|nr:Gfo/Idh/MocA family oxidoreductase [Planctomycetota bacterium]MDA1178849.1 Gfo/Idh/MocA family oxidoreductase [Planctomycetota bacterium]